MPDLTPRQAEVLRALNDPGATARLNDSTRRWDLCNTTRTFSDYLMTKLCDANFCRPAVFFCIKASFIKITPAGRAALAEWNKQHA